MKSGRYASLQQWHEAVAAYRNVLKVFPLASEVLQRLEFVLHERLFDYAEAFEVNRRRVQVGNQDLSASLDLLEKHFTTGRWNECVAFGGSLVPLVQDTSQLLLTQILILSCEVGRGDPTSVQKAAEAAKGAFANAVIARGVWMFASAKNYLRTADKLVAAQRDLLLVLFSALEEGDQAAALTTLNLFNK